MREEKRSATTTSPLLGEWTIDVVQNHKMQRALHTFLDVRQPDELRLKAARAVLRDGSRHGLILLCEAMHRALPDFFSELTRARIAELAHHPLSSIHGVLRVKALKLLKEPSSHHGRDHVSALSWLVHLCTPEDIELFLALLKHYHEMGDAPLYEEICTLIAHGTRVLWLTHEQELHDSMAWRALVHMLLIEGDPPSCLVTLLATLTTSSTPGWYEDALLYGSQLHAPSLETQAEYLAALLRLRPARYGTLANEFIARRDQQPRASRYTQSTQELQTHRIAREQLTARQARINALLREHAHSDTLDQLATSLTTNRIDEQENRTLIAHAILPYICTFSEDETRRKQLLDALWNLVFAVEHLPILWHQAHALQEAEHQLMALRLMSRSLDAQPDRERDPNHQNFWRSRITEHLLAHIEMIRALWKTGQCTEVELHHALFVLQDIVSILCRDEGAGELYTFLWESLVDEALASPRPAPPYLAELLEVMLEEILAHHFNAMASPAWQARLQTAHDRIKHHERTMLALRHALRRLKPLL